MKNRKTIKIGVVLLLILVPLIYSVDYITIKDGSKEKVEATAIISKEIDKGYLTTLEYVVNNEKYQDSIETKHEEKGNVTIYYNKENPGVISKSNRRHLEKKERNRIYLVIFIVLFIYFIFINIKYRKEIKKFYNRSEENEEQGYHRLAHYETKNKKSSDEIVVLGKITGVYKEKDSYSVGIEYEYKDEEYEFYLPGFETDISNVLKDKKISYIKVYINLEDPEMVRIDERQFYKDINKG